MSVRRIKSPMHVSPRQAGAAAFSSALVPIGFLAATRVFPVASWFDAVFVGAPMLLIPAVVILRRQESTLALRGAVLAAFFGLAGFLSIIVLLPFYEGGAQGMIPDGAFIGLLGMALMAGLGILLSSLFARTLPRYLALLGVMAAAIWMIVLATELLDMRAAPWLGAVWLAAHAAFGMALGFHLCYGATLRRNPS